jgi:hypothetical protein
MRRPTSLLPNAQGTSIGTPPVDDAFLLILSRSFSFSPLRRLVWKVRDCSNIWEGKTEGTERVPSSACLSLDVTTSHK